MAAIAILQGIIGKWRLGHHFFGFNPTVYVQVSKLEDF